MKHIYITFCLLISINSLSQVGINTMNPTESIDINGRTKIRIINESENLPLYVLSSDENGVIKKVPSNLLSKATGNPNDATKFLGGTVGVTLFDAVNGSISNTRIIGESIDSEYYMGTTRLLSKLGGLVILVGNGYKISNPSSGVYDIKFDKPFTKIYGVSANILDSYGSTPVARTPPDFSKPGTRLNTTDNTQISYIDNNGFRIKTGDSNGNLGNRSFTFLVTGQ